MYLVYLARSTMIGGKPDVFVLWWRNNKNDSYILCESLCATHKAS
jgi:hypothetical protein